VREEVSQRAYSQTRLCVQRDKTDKKKVKELWDYRTIIRLFFSYFFHISIRDPENERRKLDSMKVGEHLALSSSRNPPASSFFCPQQEINASPSGGL
jgi:hypothetical protein